MFFDTHIHSTASTDGKMTAGDAISTARSLGLGVIFTEHYDADSPAAAPGFRVDAELYARDYEKYRSEGALIGIEIGLSHLCHIRNDATVAKADFDFVIGSVHQLGLTDIYLNLARFASPPVGKTEYLEYALRMVTEYDNYDALGHIDYPSRYYALGYPSPDDARAEIDYFEYRELYDEILKTLARKEKPLEINTKRLCYKTSRDNYINILKCYASRGGRYVTIGSDAHRTEDIGKNFGIAREILDALPLTPVYFEKRGLKIISSL